MSPATKRSLFWLPGPLLAFGLVWFAVANNVLAGLFFLCLVGAIAFLFGAPLLQFVLLRTKRYQGKYEVACAISLGSITVALFVLATMGLFNFA